MSSTKLKSSNASHTKASNSKSATTTTTVAAHTIQEIETTTGSVNIPFIRSKDVAKQCPMFAAALQRSADDILPAENLDAVQLELEKLLSSVALRYRVLKTEYDNLDRDEKRNEKKRIEKAKSPESNSAGGQLNSNNKRRREEVSSSSQRKSKYGSSSSSTHKHSKYAKSSSSVSQHNEDSMEYVPNAAHAAGAQPARDANLPKLAVPKNDVPNKFWLSIEPYCMPLTNEDLRLIDELLEQYSGPLVPPIPQLGPHYSDVWAQDDVKQLQQGSSCTTLQRFKQQGNDSNTILEKAENLMDDSVTGPLTQRLVSALMEEQLLPNTNTALVANENQSDNIRTEAHGQLRSLSMLRNCIGIEQRIKKELMEQGILDESDFGPNGDEDEIHNEITRLVTELTAIADYNSDALKRLRESAVEEIKRLEIKRKLDAVDQEIMEAYKRSVQSKIKRKPLTAEEQQEIFRLTKEQKILSEQLESCQVQTFMYE